MRSSRHVFAIAVAALLTACATGERAQLTEIRRIVTIETEGGEAMVLADGPATNVRELNGSRIVRLWETGALPVPLGIAADAGATAGNAYRDGFVGTSLYVAEIPPGSSLEDIPIHRQDSLDYITVLEGEIVLVLPGQELRMRRGDILVQGGNLHSWINDTPNPCRILVVVLTGRRESA